MSSASLSSFPPFEEAPPHLVSPFFSKSILESIVTSKPIFFIFTSLLLVFFTVNALFTDGRQVFGLVPVNTLIANSFIWNLLTCSFFETNVFKLCVDLLGLYHVFIGLEYDSLENLILYIFICMMVCSLGTSFYCFLVFFVSKHETMLVSPVYGFSGIYFSLLCYARKFKQNSPIHRDLPKFTYQSIAFWIYSSQLLLYVLGIKMFSRDMIFSTISILFSWTYLRFMYKDKDGNVGDKTEAFKFVNMFPVAVHPIAIPLSTAFYNMFVLIGVFSPLESEKKVSQHHLRLICFPHRRFVNRNFRIPLYVYSYVSYALLHRVFIDACKLDLHFRPDPSKSNFIAKSSSIDVVNERRRAKAQKLLDAKMAELSKVNEDWDEKNEFQVEKENV